MPGCTWYAGHDAVVHPLVPSPLQNQLVVLQALVHCLVALYVQVQVEAAVMVHDKHSQRIRFFCLPECRTHLVHCSKWEKPCADGVIGGGGLLGESGKGRAGV
jgi:hypothetical protein